VLGFWHETNTWSPFPTTIDDFAAFELAAGVDIAEKNAGVGSVIGGFLDAEDLELALCFSAGAWPSGPLTADARSQVLERSVSQLTAAGVVDGVLLNLHGAMVAEDDQNPELTLVSGVRDVVGQVPIACVLDLHANTSPELVDQCNVVISYDTYPHVDMRARGREAASMLARMIVGGERLETSLAKVPLLACPLAQATDREPMRGLQARAHERAAAFGIERVCIVGGFAYSDVPRAGTSVLAVHLPEHRDTARQFLSETVRDLEAHEG
jgi:microcystin degradation protein MlrC